MNTLHDNQQLDTEQVGSSNRTSTPQDPSSTGRLSVNITPAERVGRIVLGAAASIVGALLLMSGGSVLAVILEVLLIAAGLDLFVTGGLGHCPLYQKLGYTPTSLRSPQ